MKNRKVFATGIGTVSPVGENTKTNFDKMKQGLSGIRGITLFDHSALTIHSGGEVKMEQLQLLPRKLQRVASRSAHFAIHATSEAMNQAEVTMSEVSSRQGVFFGNGGEFPSLELLAERKPYFKEGRLDNRTFIENVAIDPFKWFKSRGHTVGELPRLESGLRGCVRVINTACASGLHAIGEAFLAIRSGEVDFAIAGGADAMLHPVFVMGFSRLGTLSDIQPFEKASRPFDAERCGFVLSEGAGMVVLESEEHVKRRGARPLAEIKGFGSSMNAFRITDTPEDGVTIAKAIRRAINDANISETAIDYISAHGTSTQQNDKAESRAIHLVFGEGNSFPPISAIKSMIGYTIGASGAIALIWRFAR